MVETIVDHPFAQTGAEGRHVPRRTHRVVVLLCASVVLALSGLVASPSMAQARPDDGAEHLSLCEQQATTTDSSILPAMRWDDASSHLHTRLGGAVWDDVPQKIQRNGYTEQLLSLGNAFWSVTSGATETATRFCPLDKAGGAIDQAAAKIGTAILSSPLPVAGVVLALVMFLWRKRQRGGSPRQLIGTAVIIALMAVMVGGASSSTGGGANDSNAAYKPGKLSPGWFVTQTNTVISALAASPVQALTMVQARQAITTDVLSCQAYTEAQKARYRDLWGSTLATSAAAGVPLTINQMWEQSGLLAWKRAQFGTNPYADYMYCRLLESYAATPVTRGADDPKFENSISAYMVRAGADPASIVPAALAWRPSNDPVERDRKMIGWAACRAENPASGLKGPFTFSSPLFVDEGDRKGADKLCKKFFTEPHWDGDEFDAPVDVAEVIKQAGDDPEVVQFINVLHGKDSTAGPALGFAYIASGISVAAVFGLLSGAVILAKIAALVSMLALFAVMLISLFARDGLERVLRFAKQYLGLAFFVFASSLIMSALALVTGVFIDLGGSMLAGGADGLIATLWAGVAPLLAVLVLLSLFKKARIPSPFSLKGGLAWGSAASGAGAAAAGGANRFGHVMRREAVKAGRVALLPGRGGRTDWQGGGSRVSRITPGEPAVPTTGSPRSGRRYSRAEGVRRGAAAAAGRPPSLAPPGAHAPLQDSDLPIDVGLGDPAGRHTGSLAERFDASGGKLTHGDVQDFWNNELSDADRAARQAEIDRTLRRQGADAVLDSIQSAALALRRNRGKVLLAGVGLAAAPLALSLGGMATLTAGAAVAGAAAAGGVVAQTRRAKHSSLLRRAVATESAQLASARDHLLARQGTRSAGIGEPGDNREVDDRSRQDAREPDAASRGANNGAGRGPKTSPALPSSSGTDRDTTSPLTRPGRGPRRTEPAASGASTDVSNFDDDARAVVTPGPAPTRRSDSS